MPSTVATHSIPDLSPPHPGSILRDLIGELTQDEVADALRTTRYTVNQLVNGRRNVTPDMALRLGKVFGTGPEYWLKLQQVYDLHKARHEIVDDIEAMPVLRKKRV